MDDCGEASLPTVGRSSSFWPLHMKLRNVSSPPPRLTAQSALYPHVTAEPACTNYCIHLTS